MYAIIRDGGHQYRVETGQRIRVQRRDAAAGSVIAFDEVCLVAGEGAPKVGKPLVAGASVHAKVLRAEVKAAKVVTFKYRRRKNSQRLRGHRQKFTEVQITEIRG
jgi:large subunit ribosomal protein L21